MNQLTTIEKMAPLDVFGGNLDAILGKIGEEAKSQPLDISTDKGRKEIASLAYKIARSKTFIDDLGKKLGEEAQAKLNAINAERKKSRDYLDVLKEEIRAPLTGWEETEKKRIADHQAALLEIQNTILKTLSPGTGIKQIESQIQWLESYQRDWQEFDMKAKAEIICGVQSLKNAYNQAVEREKERLELETLRVERAAREQKDREDKIAAEAAERATKAAEETAKKEAARVAEAAERERQKIIYEKEQAEKLAAAELMAKERQLQDEKTKQEREAKAKADAERKREMDKAHAAKINNEVVQALMDNGIVEGFLATDISKKDELAKRVVVAIATGKIPHTRIQY